MVSAAKIADLEVEAFRINAIRSVLLVDEGFPKYDQVGSDDFQSADADIGKRLYQSFNKMGVLCDIENDVELATEKLTNPIRKSDLLVLDLHLDATNPNDSTEAIKILQNVAASDHFNLVLVYTGANQFGQVVRMLAGSLRGAPAVDDLSWADLKETNLEPPTEKCVERFLLPDCQVGPELGKFRGRLGAKLKELNAGGQVDDFIAKYGSVELQKAGAVFKDDVSLVIEAENFDADNPWFVCGSAFVVLASKKVGPEDGKLIKILDKAIVDWNPGVVRSLLSEIQNCSTRSGFPFKTLIESDRLTQVGWLHHAVQQSKLINDAACNEGGCTTTRPTSDLIRRIVGVLQNGVLEDTSLSEFSGRCLEAITFDEEPAKRVSELCTANGISKPPDDFDLMALMHELNRFMSSEDFPQHVTTGTILRSTLDIQVGDKITKAKDWWLCVEPACDTVPGQAKDNRFLKLTMLRLRPLLKPEEQVETVRHATRSRYVFLKHQDTRLYFDTRNAETDLPDLLEVYVSRDSQVREENGKQVVDIWQSNLKADAIEIRSGTAELVDQLRESNANRLLNEAGAHQSRIGVNFVDCTKEDAAKLGYVEGEA